VKNSQLVNEEFRSGHVTHRESGDSRYRADSHEEAIHGVPEFDHRDYQKRLVR
jgi:hypothetical protein